VDVLTPRSAEPPRAAWTLWYEDESLEDCGLASNVEGVDCLDRWQSTGRGFASLDDCQALKYQWNARAAEEFRCAEERPPSERDDGRYSGR